KDLSPDADVWEKADREQRVEHPDFVKTLKENSQKHLDTGDKTLAEVSKLVGDLNKILDAIPDVVEEDQLTAALARIEGDHRGLTGVYELHFQEMKRWLKTIMG